MGLKQAQAVKDISTHALTEGDSEPARHLLAASHFNSRPHGGRPLPRTCRYGEQYFNSRPHGGRQQRPQVFAIRMKISTHALTEGDLC